MIAFWKRSQLRRCTRKESIVKIVRVHAHQLQGLRDPPVLQVILELTQLDREEADQIPLIRREQAGQANQEYQGLSPYQNDLRTSCLSGHLDPLKERPPREELSMQKVMSNHL